jgi:hypothetical protein
MSTLTKDAHEITNLQWPLLQFKGWIQSNTKKVNAAKELQGGWEVWAQVELALVLAAETARVRNVVREEPIFTNQGPNPPRVDIWFPSSNREMYDNVGVELKCRTKRENSTSFKGRVVQDVKKILNNKGPRAELKPAWMYATGLTADENDTKGWPENVVDREGRQWDVEFYYTKISDGATGLTFYLIWWQIRYQK